MPVPPLRIVLAGAAGSAQRTLDALLRHRAQVVGVLQLRGESAHTVTGYAPLDVIAAPAGIPCGTFRNINDPETVARIRDWRPDLLFVIGLGQLVRDELLAVPRLGCVGFHPTFLPAGRGRAPLAWLTLDGRPGAATFFVIDPGTDSGPILAQEPFEVRPDDYAGDVAARMDEALERVLERWLPRLLAGEWNPRPQDEVLATYHGRRGPEDGLIDWHQPADRIHALIRASSTPHPGAYTWVRDRKLIVWRADRERHLPWRGVPGRVLLREPGRGALLQTGDGLLWLRQVQWSDESAPRPAEECLTVGTRLGFVVQDELAALRARVAALEARLARLDPLDPDSPAN